MAASKRLQMVVPIRPGCKVLKTLYPMKYNGIIQVNGEYTLIVVSKPKFGLVKT